MRNAMRDGGVRAVHLWRRSLGFRVVVLTMLLGMVVLAAVGTYLYGAIGRGLVESRERVVEADSAGIGRSAQSFLSENDEVDTRAKVQQAAENLVGRYRVVSGSERRYVVLSRAEGNTSPTVIGPIESNSEIGVRFVPAELRTQVSQQGDRQFMQVTTIEETGREISAIIVGQRLDVPLVGEYCLYLIYPLQRERDVMDLVGKTFLLGGIALLLLVGAVAAVVTRIVTDPVRRAAQVAEEFSAGNFDVRMRARGEDDLARMGSSFNAMAGSIQQQITQLENLSHVQQRFVSDVSHELRTPLTTIRMAGEVIHDARSGFDPIVARSAELLHGELDRFELLLADLLEISRFDAGAAVLDLEPTDLRAIVERVVQATSTLAATKGSAVHVLADGPAVAEVDSRRIERVLRNLLVNAVEHGEGRPIEITLACNESAVAVTVRDHGVGLQPGQAAMVFTRFWRADPARARTTGGTGLGLAISLEDARLHAGRLEAWGVPGEGSQFRLTLPRQADGTIHTSPLPLRPGAARSGRSGRPGPLREDEPLEDTGPGGRRADDDDTLILRLPGLSQRGRDIP